MYLINPDHNRMQSMSMFMPWDDLAKIVILQGILARVFCRIMFSYQCQRTLGCGTRRYRFGDTQLIIAYNFFHLTKSITLATGTAHL